MKSSKRTQPLLPSLRWFAFEFHINLSSQDIEEPSGRSRFTTIETLLREMRDELSTSFRHELNHDSEKSKNISEFLESKSFNSTDPKGFEELLKGSVAFEIIIDDPLGISGVWHREDEAEQDENIREEFYDRTILQRMELGIVDMEDPHVSPLYLLTLRNWQKWFTLRLPFVIGQPEINI